MAEELGKIERPQVGEFKKGRKLYFIPLILSSPEENAALTERLKKYWEQVQTHLANLEDKLGRVTLVFHELLSMSGEEGLTTLSKVCEPSLRIVKQRVEQGAHLQAIEDGEVLLEFMDWGRCLAIGLQSQHVFNHVYEAYKGIEQKRNETIAKKIGEALLEGETAILLMREGHQIQFPPDIQIFYISPPALDEIKRWVRDQDTDNQAVSESGAENRTQD